MHQIGHSTCGHPTNTAIQAISEREGDFKTPSEQDGNTLPEEAKLLHGEAASAKAAASQRREQETTRGTEQSHRRA